MSLRFNRIQINHTHTWLDVFKLFHNLLKGTFSKPLFSPQYPLNLCHNFHSTVNTTTISNHCEFSSIDLKACGSSQLTDLYITIKILFYIFTSRLGLMFWSSFADSYNVGGKIEMSWMDGTSREVLAAKNINGNSSIYWPVSLSYYKDKKKLYWLDVLSQTIDSITIDDKKTREQRKIGAFYSQSLAILAGKVFWTDNLKDTIEVVNIESTDYKK
jgi:hypothetical protein